MIKEAFEFIAGLVTKAATIKRVNVEADIGDKVLLQMPDGTIREELAYPKRRKLVARGVGDLVAAIIDHQDPLGDPEHVQVFVSDTEVNVHLDPYLRNVVQLTFEHSDRWEGFLGLLEKKLEPAPMVRFLRSRLDCEGAQELLNSLRSVDFTRRSSGKSSIEHGRESMGKAVEAEVQGVKDIPETVTLTLSPYSNPGARSAATVRCVVDLFPSEGVVSLTALPDQIGDAEAAVRADAAAGIAQALQAAKIPHTIIFADVLHP